MRDREVPVYGFPMAERKNIIIIGSGIGGITTAAFLSARGHRVQIFEKNPYAGGRSGMFEKEGHRFDMGATFLMMPGVYEDTFSRLGRTMAEELKLQRMDPVYQVKFPGGQQIRFTSDLARMQKQFETIEPGSYGKFLQLMNEGFRIYERSMPLIDRNYFTPFDPSLVKFPFLLLRYRGFHNQYRYVSRFFKSEELRAFFTFQNLYMGQDPFSASGMYLFLPFMELADGVYFPEGGMHRVAQRILEIAVEQGTGLRVDAPVAAIKVEGKRATGVSLEDGSFHRADVVVSNADLPFTYNHLLPPGKKARRLNKLSYSCSAVVFHWGIGKVYPQLSQHNVFVSATHRESCRTIFREHGFAEAASIYVHSPVRSDPSAAPDGQDSVTAIIHTGNIDGSRTWNWEEVKQRARDSILRRFEQEGMKDFREQIKFEMCFTPDLWKSVFNLSRGGTFGSVGHNILQMGFLRPANHHRKYNNLVFVGGSTLPGSGMPLALISAKLATERVERMIQQGEV
jgi:phytoene desaturase